jgi:hypothetical protein
VIDWEPVAFVARIVYWVLARVVVGVPEITPVDVEKLKPAVDKAGEIE